MQPGVLTALASAAIVAPDDALLPPALDPAVRAACAGAWRAVEVVLAGDVLRGRLGRTRDTFVRDGVEALLGLFANVAVRPEPLAALRAARADGALDGALDLVAIAARVRTEGAASVGKTAIASVQRELATYPALAAALADHELAALLIDAARSLFRHHARDPELARWAIGPTGVAGRDRALVAFAELIGSPASVDELELLIALPIHLDENVQFTVYRPRSIDPGRWHPMLAFAHLADRRLDEPDAPDPVEEVRRQAESVLGDRARGYQPVTQDAGAAIPAEGELVFVPEIAGIEFNPPRRSFLWLEAVHREEFRMRAGRELDGKTVRGRLTVFLGHIAIAEVPLSVRVDERRPEPTVREPSHARAYRRIFASYSHRDLAIVNQFETYARALGDEYLRDWIHLRTGEVWNDRLRQLIEQADAFQLFWSHNSMHSKFVRAEYEHALSLNRPSFVRPTYWEDPMPTAPGLPPEALLRLHFQKLGGGFVPASAEHALADAHPRRGRPAAAMPPPEAKAYARAEVMRDELPTLPEPALDREAAFEPELEPAPERARVPQEAPLSRAVGAESAAAARRSAAPAPSQSSPLPPDILAPPPAPQPDPAAGRRPPTPGYAGPGSRPSPPAPASSEPVQRPSPSPSRASPGPASRPSPSPAPASSGPASRPSPSPAPAASGPTSRPSPSPAAPASSGPASRPSPSPATPVSSGPASRPSPAPAPGPSRPAPSPGYAGPGSRAPRPAATPPPSSPPPMAIPVLAIPDPRRDTARQAAAVPDETLDAASTSPAMQIDRERTATQDIVDEFDPTDPLIARKQEQATAPARTGPRPPGVDRSVEDDDDDPVIEPPPPAPPPKPALRPARRPNVADGARAHAPDDDDHDTLDSDAEIPSARHEALIRDTAPAQVQNVRDTVPAFAQDAYSEETAQPDDALAVERRKAGSDPKAKRAVMPGASRSPAIARAATAPAPNAGPVNPVRSASAPIANPARTAGAPPPDEAPTTLAERPSEPALADEPSKIPNTLPSKAPPPPAQPAQPVAPARPSLPGGRVICDRCGTENAGHLRFCASCGTALATPSVPPTPRKEVGLAPVSPYAPTVPQPQYQGEIGSMQANKARRASPEAPAQSARWPLIVALVLLVVVAAVAVYLVLR